MTGPEHYLRAERLIRQGLDESDPVLMANLLAAAQVHATLALTAATADNDPEYGQSTSVRTAWRPLITPSD